MANYVGSIFDKPTLAEFDERMKAIELSEKRKARDRAIQAKRARRLKIRLSPGPFAFPLSVRLERYKLWQLQKRLAAEADRRLQAQLQFAAETKSRDERWLAAYWKRHAARAASKWPEERLRRSRVNWCDILPPDLAHLQVGRELDMTALAMRQAGWTFRKIGAAFGVVAETARGRVERGERTFRSKRCLTVEHLTGAPVGSREEALRQQLAITALLSAAPASTDSFEPLLAMLTACDAASARHGIHAFG